MSSEGFSGEVKELGSGLRIWVLVWVEVGFLDGIWQGGQEVLAQNM